MTAAGVPPGWYRDPAGQLRWWDGYQWGPAAPYPAAPPSTTVAVLAHLSFLIGGFVAAIVIYATVDPNDRFTRAHAAEALNMQLTVLCVFFPVAIVGFAVAAVAAAPLLFFAAWLACVATIVVNIIWGIRAAIRASRREPWRYPVRIGFVRGSEG